MYVTRMLLVAAVVATGTVVVAAPPAAADHCTPYVEPDPDGPGTRIVRPCGPGTDANSGHDDESGDGSGGGGGSDVTCEQTYWPPGTEPEDPGEADGGPFYWWRDIETREDGGTWGHGFFECTNHDTGEEFDANWWVCYLNCDSESTGPSWSDVLDGLLQQAYARVDLPLPGIRHTFDQPADDGTIRAIVLAETWWWAENYDPVVEEDSDGPVWVRVTATPSPLTIDPGDGSGTFQCDGPGLAYNRNLSYYDQIPGEPRGACVHVYERVADSVTASMSITWTVTWQGFAPGLGPVSGSLGALTSEQIATFPVKEIQSVIVR